VWPPCALRDALLELRISSAEREMRLRPEVVDTEVDTWRDHDGDIVAQGYTAAGHHWLHFPDFATYRFCTRPSAVTVMPEATTSTDALHDWHRRTVLPLALQALGLESLHASGVVVPEGVIAFCGFPRTGKSTMAFALHRRGYRLWADDSVVIHAAQVVQAIPLPCHIRLRPASRAHFGMNGHVPDPRDEWSGPPLSDAPMPLAAVFVLTRGGAGDETSGFRVRRLSSAAAFHAVLSHAQCFSLRERARKQRMLEAYLALAARLPVVEVRFQPGFDKLPAVLDAVEHTISGIVSPAA
jgi:hypothetical protein